MGGARIGMFGLGDIGAPITSRLAGRFEVLAYDPSPQAGAALDAVTRAATPGEVISGCTTVVLCLPAPAVVVEVVGDICTNRGSVALIVDLSTIGVTASQAAAEVARGAGIGYVDAPISGSVRKAAAGELTVMAAGPDAALEAAAPVLDAIGSHVIVLGHTAGLGQAMKLANNIINAAAMAVTCEAIAFGVSMGLDMAQMVEVLNVSTGRTSASVEKFPGAVVPGSYAFGARGELVAKDALLFLDAARAAGIETSLAEACAALWDEHIRAHPGADVSTIYRHVAGDQQPWS